GGGGGGVAGGGGGGNGRVLGLVQRFVRLLSEGRADELAGDFTEIVGLIPDEPRSAACAQALLNARRGRLAEARADLDRAVAGTVPRDGEWLPKYVQVAVAAVLARHRAAARGGHPMLEPVARGSARGGDPARSRGRGRVAAHRGLRARSVGGAEDADGYFARAAELDAGAGAALAARTREWAGGSAPDGVVLSRPDEVALSRPEGVGLFRLEGEVWT